MTQPIRSAVRFSPGRLATAVTLFMLGISSAVAALGDFSEKRTSGVALRARTAVHVSYGYGDVESGGTSDIDALVSNQDANRERVPSSRNEMPPNRGTFSE